MGGPTKPAAQSNHVHGHGKLSLAGRADAPLLLVFGGIPVGGVQSGVYMWNYMNALKDRYHIFVATSNTTPGTLAYKAVMAKLASDDIDITPSEQILYLFSGGYGPGMNVLHSSGPATFSAIHLVDIWMGNKTVADFYKKLADTNSGKMTYTYTTFGANSPETRDYIADRLGPTRATLVEALGEGKKKEGGMATHLRTNTIALLNL
ncbi:MAG TPA: hypothetical protein VH109_00085 [Steroidobacteraceae bacterium]|jgi:hypothetical protein|nr:hypothetical protein [Steroidobacteraceae bacterium]